MPGKFKSSEQLRNRDRSRWTAKWPTRAELIELTAEYEVEIEGLREAIRAELTHGGIRDRIAQETSILGALSEKGSDVYRSAERLDADRAAFTDRMTAALLPEDAT